MALQGPAEPSVGFPISKEAGNLRGLEKVLKIRPDDCCVTRSSKIVLPNQGTAGSRHSDWNQATTLQISSIENGGSKR